MIDTAQHQFFADLRSKLEADLEASRAADAMLKPLLVQVAYSGGKASEMLMHMILRGEIEIPAPHLIVTCADPGMENPMTHIHTNAMEERCKARGIPFLRAKVNLYEGILKAKAAGATRFDFPAFFTRNRETGSIGKMKQRCTDWCKISPMDRLARNWMHANLHISKVSRRIGTKILCKWIGFTFDEVDRIKPHRHAKYVYFRYPLAEKRIRNDDMIEYYNRNGLLIPPRSVCNACFANDEEYFKRMYETQPESWAQAVAIDEAIRDLSQFGMNDECFVYAGCVPLKELARLGFPILSRKSGQACHCPLLDTKTNKCSVYDIRPAICVLYGSSTAEHLTCPHNCKPANPLNQEETHQTMSKVEQIAGGKANLSLFGI